MKLSILWRLSIAPAAVALIAFAVTTFGGTISYTYDSAGRLTAANLSGNRSINYGYDAAGNLTSNTVFVPTDTDGDGLDDNWEIFYFGDLSRNGTGDFDNDGMSDLAEYLAGTLPNNTSSRLLITHFATTAGTNTSIEWAAVAGKPYRVQYKNSLSETTWSVLSGDVTATGTTASKADPAPGNPRRFYRIVLVP